MTKLLDSPIEQRFIQSGVSWESFKAIQSGFADSPCLIATGSFSQEKEAVASAQADESYCFGERKPVPDLAIKGLSA